MSQLVTGDAVVLGLQPAKVPSRAMAVAVDLVVIVGSYLLITSLLLNVVFSLGEAVAATVFVASMVLVLVGVPVAVETLSRGRSLGKLVFGLRVVREDGGPVRFRHALVRGLVGFVELIATFGFLATVSSLVSPQGRRLGDVFAGTMVVRERIPTSSSTLLPPPPPHLAGEFRGLDLSRVPDELWLTVRQLLVRMPKLSPQVAWAMAERLAGDVARLVGTPPPQGLDAVTYLTVVAGERQRRDAERVFGPGGGAGAPGSWGAPGGPGVPGGWGAPGVPGGWSAGSADGGAWSAPPGGGAGWPGAPGPVPPAGAPAPPGVAPAPAGPPATAEQPPRPQAAPSTQGTPSTRSAADGGPAGRTRGDGSEASAGFTPPG